MEREVGMIERRGGGAQSNRRVREQQVREGGSQGELLGADGRDRRM